FADIYPGLAKAKVLSDGRKTYHFNGVIRLMPDQLANPLIDRVPKMIFVNSTSDSFHPKVPDAFIEYQFTVMENAPWHIFQVLTKRPERMAAFTQKRYKNTPPPAHIWMGSTTEDQKNYDERIIHLRNTIA